MGFLSTILWPSKVLVYLDEMRQWLTQQRVAGMQHRHSDERDSEVLEVAEKKRERRVDLVQR